jgi:hypothetical protein
MAPNEDPQAVTSERVSSHASVPSNTPARPDSERTTQVRTSPPVNIITHLISVSVLIVQEE